MMLRNVARKANMRHGSHGLLASAVLTPLGLLGKLGARNILGNWAAQIVTFEGAFSRVRWTLQNRDIREAAISFRGARPPQVPRNSSTVHTPSWI